MDPDPNEKPMPNSRIGKSVASSGEESMVASGEEAVAALGLKPLVQMRQSGEAWVVASVAAELEPDLVPQSSTNGGAEFVDKTVDEGAIAAMPSFNEGTSASPASKVAWYDNWTPNHDEPRSPGFEEAIYDLMNDDDDDTLPEPSPFAKKAHGGNSIKSEDKLNEAMKQLDDLLELSYQFSRSMAKDGAEAVNKKGGNAHPFALSDKD
jgi:hypothetical protein